MFNILKERLQQKFRTMAYPDAPPPPRPDRFRGLPVLQPDKCPDGCQACVESCPTDAIQVHNKKMTMDLGKCLFCTDCMNACPPGAIGFSTDHRLAVRSRDGLLFSGQALALADKLEKKMLRLFGRSLKLRQVSAGGCNACEADVNVLNTIVWDLSRFGIQFVASPRHADGLLITGPVTDNMKLALQKTHAAVPTPKLVIAVGACAINGGPFLGHEYSNDGADSVLPVDLYIPGCPPHPLTILDGLLRLLGRIDDAKTNPPAETTSPR